MGVRFVVRSRAGQKLAGEPEFPFDQGRIVIGRGGSADVRIPDRSVSENHATVQQRDDHYVISDLGSTNGTRLESQRLTPEVPKRLRDGDRIEIGSYMLSFHSGVPVTESVSADRTAELARRMLRDAELGRGKPVAPPRLCVLSGPRTGATLELPVAAARLVIGSAETCQLVLPDAELAPEHAELVCDLDGVSCRSLPGKSPFLVGGHASSSRRLRDGDELVLGGTRLLFEEPVQALLDALKLDPDELVPPPPQLAPASAANEPTQTLTQAGDGPPPSAAARNSAIGKPPRQEADLLIYGLAAVVLMASVLGLLFLFHAR